MERHITWEEVRERCRDIHKWIRQHLPTPCKVYGIPRGGSWVALMLFAMGGVQLCCEKEADLIVDEIADTGKTLSKYRYRLTAVMYSRKDCKVATFSAEEVGPEWLVFPWERERKLFC